LKEKNFTVLKSYSVLAMPLVLRGEYCFRDDGRKENNILYSRYVLKLVLEKIE